MDSNFSSLLELLTDEEAEIPRARLAELSDLDNAHLERLLGLWPELTSSRRAELIEELGRMADEQIELRYEGINLSVLQDDDARVRLQAIRNLWEVEDASLAETLIGMLESDGSASVRQAAAHALGRFVYLSELDKLGGENQLELEAALIHACGDDRSAEVRDACLISLGYSSHPEVPDLILNAYRSGEEAQLLAALKAMGRSANDLWREQVLEQLHSPSPELRAEAVKAAGELELREASDDLVAHLDDVSDRVRHAAIWALGQLGGSAAREALGNMVEDAVNEQESQLVNDALDNLIFVDGTKDFPLIDFDPSEDSAS